MKRIGLFCVTVLAGLSLAGCSNLASEPHKTANSNSSTKVVKHHKDHKKTAKESSNKATPSSSDSSSQTTTNSNATSQQGNGNQQATVQPNNGGNSGQQQGQGQQSTQNSNSASTDNIHDFVNTYGESPAAYKMNHDGMSQQQALETTPDNMKTSGELQTQHLMEQGQ